MGFDFSCNDNLNEISKPTFWENKIDCVGFKDTSTLVGHFVLSPRERKKRDRRDSSGDEREGQG